MSELLEARLELLDELFCDVFMNESAGRSNAGLTRVEQEVLTVMLQGNLKVGVWEDKTGRLATQLEGHTFEVARLISDLTRNVEYTHTSLQQVPVPSYQRTQIQ